MPFNLFGSKQETFIGLDIGTSSIKVVELSSDNGRPKLENYGILENLTFTGTLPQAPLPVSGMLPTGIFYGQAVPMTRHLFAKAEMGKNKVSVAAPIVSSFLTVMSLPPMSEEELAGAIQFEAREYVPVPLEQLILDWAVIGSTMQGIGNNHQSAANAQSLPPQTNHQKLQVLLIAIPRDLVTEYARIASEIGLDLTAIELETVSAARAIVGSDPTPTAILDLGARSSTISIVDGGFLQISHAVDTSGEDLTRALARGLNINTHRAEQLKRERGLKSWVGEAEIASVITPFLSVIVSSLQNIMQLHIEKTGRKVEKAVLYGGAANLFELDKFLAEKLNMEVSFAAPFKRVIYPKELDPIIGHLNITLTVALGLALRNFQ